MPEPEAFNNLMRARAKALHEKDAPPATRKDWEGRRKALREAMFAAMGPMPGQACPLEVKEFAALQRDGYRIERLIFQSRPDVWVTANAYVPEKVKGRVPAVLVVHGHWAGARRDPVVQARCLGLVKLGYFVLAVDAFGSGERYTRPALGTYHGALYGSPLWPAGLTLLGCQVYDNRRAVDYLLTRPEVDGERLGITGASGGGNQTMYAGALDERIGAVVPVCSVGTYQAYLRAACCVCEVLPGALRFAEEGDVLALVAPRALLVINATKDGIQFSVGEAEKSIARARPVFTLLGAENKLKHATFESPHAYNQQMREAMYGWMALSLRGEGTGKPILEPAHTIEKPEDLAVFSDDNRPKGFLYPPGLAAREAAAVLAKLDGLKPDHAEDWESAAVHMRTRLRKEVFGDFPAPPKMVMKAGEVETAGDVTTTPSTVYPEPDMPLPVVQLSKAGAKGKRPACVLLHLDGKAAALKHPLAKALLDRGVVVRAPDLRATGETKPASDVIAGAPDHTSAEHALWVGRPLLGQWVFDVQHLFDWLTLNTGLDRDRLAVVGIGQAGLIALCAAGLDERVSAAAAIDAPATLVTEQAYAAGTHMGLLAPGLFRVGDVRHLAALAAPRRVVIAGGVSPQGKALTEKALKVAYGFTASVYKLHKADAKLTVAEAMKPEDLAAALLPS
jgi:cephalosporin-C deacetylase-like acetyl esterase